MCRKFWRVQQRTKKVWRASIFGVGGLLGVVSSKRLYEGPTRRSLMTNDLGTMTRRVGKSTQLGVHDDAGADGHGLQFL